MKIGIIAQRDEDKEKAETLQEKLRPSFDVALVSGQIDLENWQKSRKAYTQGPFQALLVCSAVNTSVIALWEKLAPFQIEFSSPAMMRRLKQASIKTELIAKAVGMKKNTPIKILDATMGLAKDSLLMSYLGAEVTAIERSPLIGALMEEALEKAKGGAQVSSPLNDAFNRLRFKQADAKQEIDNIDPDRAPVIYLDPMFPDKTKNAQVKKDMQMLQTLIGVDADAEALLEAALASPSKRVVLKRPKLAPVIGSREPDLQFKGSSSRFDVYLKP